MSIGGGGRRDRGGAADERSDRIARGPLSNRLAKSLMDAALDQPMDAALSLANAAQQRIFDGPDLREGAQAFFAKRDPVFPSRSPDMEGRST